MRANVLDVSMCGYLERCHQRDVRSVNLRRGIGRAFGAAHSIMQSEALRIQNILNTNEPGLPCQIQKGLQFPIYRAASSAATN
jgi:hypothetical protein